jgi:hypothetical protein
MKLIIAGSRTFNFYTNKKTKSFDVSYIDSFLNIFNIFPSEVICGCGGTSKEKVEKLRKEGCLVSDQGIDRLGEYWADSNRVNRKYFPPDWIKNGKPAGPIRNKQMAEYADALLLIWDGESKGSKNMKEEMKKLNKPVYEVVIKRG